MEIGGETLILTHDMMAEEVHWLPGTEVADIAHKLVATNLSDLAAKGAETVGALLAFGLADEDYNHRFARCVCDTMEQYDLPLLGGDTIDAGRRIIGMTAIGRATHIPVPSRAGAAAGDAVWVCGTIGDAMIGHAQLTRGAVTDPYFVRKFLRPEPLLAQGRALAPIVTAMMDISDGLLIDAARMATASGVTFDIDPAEVPFSTKFLAALDDEDTRDAAMRWGDDYALLLTLPVEIEPPVEARRIGKVVPAAEFPILLAGEPPQPTEKLGYSH